MDPFRTRAAHPDEAGAIVPLYAWLFASPGVEPPSWDVVGAETALQEAIGGPATTVLVAELSGGAIAGFCTVYIDLRSVRFGLRAWVEDLAVDPGQRSLGIGKALLDAAKAWARQQGASHLELDSAFTRADAHRFYDREQPTWTSKSFGWMLS